MPDSDFFADGGIRRPVFSGAVLGDGTFHAAAIEANGEISVGAG